MSPAPFPPEPSLTREIRLSELELRVNKDHPAYASVAQMFEERINGDVGMTALINFGNVAGLTLGYKLHRLTGEHPGVKMLWVPDAIPGPQGFNYMITRFDL